MLGVTVWPFEPDWSEPVVFLHGYHTDVLPAYRWREQRAALRRHPVGGLEFAFLLNDLWEAQRANVLIHRKHAQLWAVPLWPWKVRLDSDVAPGATAIQCQTGTVPFLDAAGFGPYALLYRDARTLELVQLSTVGPTQLALSAPVVGSFAASTAYVLPVRTARLERPVTAQWDTSKVFSGHVRFSFDAWSAVSAAGGGGGGDFVIVDEIVLPV